MQVRGRGRVAVGAANARHDSQGRRTREDDLPPVQACGQRLPEYSNTVAPIGSGSCTLYKTFGIVNFKAAPTTPKPIAWLRLRFRNRLCILRKCLEANVCCKIPERHRVTTRMQLHAAQYWAFNILMTRAMRCAVQEIPQRTFRQVQLEP